MVLAHHGCVFKTTDANYISMTAAHPVLLILSYLTVGAHNAYVIVSFYGLYLAAVLFYFYFSM